MTDPELADATYVEPLTPEFLERIIERSGPTRSCRPSAGRRRINLALALAERGVLEKRSVRADRRQRARRCAWPRTATSSRRRCSRSAPRCRAPARARSLAEAEAIARGDRPAASSIRPSFTLGGSGGGVGAHAGGVPQDRRRTASPSRPTHEVLIEESVEGWKEFELEVMRDTADNVIIVCSIENFDAMGVHTGDSITVAPQMTLSDRQYQAMRDEAKAVIRKVGVDTGGSNIQFAVDPKTGRRVVIEMNPRVSRSSALASKATGFPIAKIAALLAVGYHLDEIPNDITKKTPASLRAVARLRRRQDPALDVREVSARRPAPDDPDEVGRRGDGDRPHVRRGARQGDPLARDRPRRPGRRRAARCRGRSCSRGSRCRRAERIFHLRRAFVAGMTVEEIAAHTRIDPWFLDARAADGRGRGARFAGRELAGRHARRAAATPSASGSRTASLARRAGRRRGARSARARRRARRRCPSSRRSTPARPSSRRETPYFYSTYEDENESIRTDRPKVVDPRRRPEPDRAGDRVRLLLRPRLLRALGGGLRDRHDQLQPGDGLDGLRHVRPALLRAADLRGRLGGPRQREARRRARAVRRPDAAEARARRSRRPAIRSGAPRPNRSTSPRTAAASASCSASSASRAPAHAEARDRGGGARRPAGGSATRSSCGRPTSSAAARWRSSSTTTRLASLHGAAPSRARREHPVLIDRFLDDAVELDVDALCDGKDTWIGGIQQHIEEAGIHSGDSFSVLPPGRSRRRCSPRSATRRGGSRSALSVRGLVNIQFAIQHGKLYVLEVNPRASRTVPFVSKAIGVPMARAAALLAAGQPLAVARTCRPSATRSTSSSRRPSSRSRSSRARTRCSGPR